MGDRKGGTEEEHADFGADVCKSMCVIIAMLEEGESREQLIDHATRP